MTHTEEEATFTFPDDLEAANGPIPDDVRELERTERLAELNDEWGYDSDAEALATREDSVHESSWSEADVLALFAEGLEEPPPSVGHREDGRALLYRNKVSSIAGEPESNKGWFACAIAAQVVRNHESVVYIDFEDSAKSILNRMRQLGLSNAEIAARFHVINPHESLGDVNDKEGNARGRARWEHFRVVLRRATSDDYESQGIGLVVFDGITQALANEDLDPNKNDDVTKWFATVPRKVAAMRSTHPAVLLIDHVTKASAAGRYAIGAGSKLAAVDGAQFKAKVEQPSAPGKAGYIKITVTKDRPGMIRKYTVGSGIEQTITEMRLSPVGDKGQVIVAFDVPSLDKIVNEATREATMADAMTVFLREARSDKNKTDIYASVKGASDMKVKVLNKLIDDNIVGKVGKGYVIKGNQ